MRKCLKVCGVSCEFSACQQILLTGAQWLHASLDCHQQTIVTSLSARAIRQICISPDSSPSAISCLTHVSSFCALRSWGANAIAVTAWPGVMVASGFELLLMFFSNQSLTVPSREAVAKHEPSALHDSPQMILAWPLIRCCSTKGIGPACKQHAYTAAAAACIATDFSSTCHLKCAFAWHQDADETKFMRTKQDPWRRYMLTHPLGVDTQQLCGPC